VGGPDEDDDDEDDDEDDEPPLLHAAAATASTSARESARGTDTGVVYAGRAVLAAIEPGMPPAVHVPVPHEPVGRSPSVIRPSPNFARGLSGSHRTV